MPRAWKETFLHSEVKLDLLPEWDTDLFEVAINTIITLSQYYDCYKYNRRYRKHEQSPPRIKVAATVTMLIEERSGWKLGATKESTIDVRSR